MDRKYTLELTKDDLEKMIRDHIEDTEDLELEDAQYEFEYEYAVDDSVKDEIDVNLSKIIVRVKL